jgi:hypothetical protein
VKPSIVPQPGDILAVRSPGWGPRIIRFGAAMRELVSNQPEPNLANHIAVVSHTDKAGTLWCLEGRPGGVGWRDSSDYLRSPWTVSNIGQPKTAAQRKTVCDGAVAMIGTPYDWEGIAADAADALDLGALWHPRFGQVPGHVVCSSLAAWLYGKAGLDKPAGDREVSPADWLAFIIGHKFEGQPQ